MEKVLYTVAITEFVNTPDDDFRTIVHKYTDLSYPEYKEVMKMVAGFEPTDKRDFKVFACKQKGQA